MNHLRAAFSDVPVNRVEIQPGVVCRDSNMTVSVFEVVHSSFGYCIQANDRTIVISGETIPVDAVVTGCNGCDLLCHEVYGLTDDPNNPTASYDTSATALGELARAPSLSTWWSITTFAPHREAARTAIAKDFRKGHLRE